MKAEYWNKWKIVEKRLKDSVNARFGKLIQFRRFLGIVFRVCKIWEYSIGTKVKMKRYDWRVGDYARTLDGIWGEYEGIWGWLEGILPTYINQSHLLLVIHTIYWKAPLVDEVVQSWVLFYQKFSWIGILKGLVSFVGNKMLFVATGTVDLL